LEKCEITGGLKNVFMAKKDQNQILTFLFSRGYLLKMVATEIGRLRKFRECEILLLRVLPDLKDRLRESEKYEKI
jgi:hypothetical protein